MRVGIGRGEARVSAHVPLQAKIAECSCDAVKVIDKAEVVALPNSAVVEGSRHVESILPPNRALTVAETHFERLTGSMKSGGIERAVVYTGKHHAGSLAA